jgi:TRAP transporter TAXI family solute receptor
MKAIRILSILAILVIALGLVTACSSQTESTGDNGSGTKSETNSESKTDSSSEPEVTKVILSTAGTSGTFYPVGASISQIVNNNEPTLKVTSQASGGSVENVRLLKNKEVEFALLGGDSAVGAYNGTGEEFAGNPHDDVLRGLFSMYSQPLSLVTLKKSGITSFDDLKGKKVAVGAPGSGSEVKSKQVLELLGLPYDSGVKQEYLSFAEAVDGMKDGQIDAAFVWAGIPAPAVMDLANVHGINLVQFTQEQVDKVNKENPSIYGTAIPGGTYEGVDNDTLTLAVNTQAVVRADVDDEVVYKYLSAIFANLEDLHNAVDAMKELTIESAPKNVIELHPGAKKFYQDKGVLD